MSKSEIEIDIIVKFDLKNIDKIFLINKNTDPLTAFYEQLIVDTNNIEAVLLGARPNPSSVIINDGLYKREVYGRILPKYAKKIKGDMFTQKHLDLAISMLDLDIGPRTSADVPEDEIWITKGFLTHNDE